MKLTFSKTINKREWKRTRKGLSVEDATALKTKLEGAGWTVMVESEPYTQDKIMADLAFSVIQSKLAPVNIIVTDEKDLISKIPDILKKAVQIGDQVKDNVTLPADIRALGGAFSALALLHVWGHRG
jgi:hypothetical protein